MKNIPIKAKGEPRKVPYLQRCLLYNWFNKKNNNDNNNNMAYIYKRQL